MFVPLLQDESFLYQMTPSQQTLANTLRVSAPPNLLPLIDQLSASLIPGNNPQVVSLFRENSGVFPFSEQRQQFMTRFDHRLGDGHNLFFRGNWTGQDNQNTSFGSLVAYSRGRNSNVKDFSLVLGDTYVISPQWVSETRLGMGYYDLGVYPTDVNGPEIGINGFGLFGRDFILPTRVVERTWQLRQNFIRVSGRHTFKFGADINPLRDAVRAETFFGGRFTFGEAVPLSNLIDNAGGAGLSQLIKISLQNAGRAGLAATVDQPISSLQAYALGLPIIYQQGFGDPNWVGWANRYNFFAEDSWRLTRNFLLTLAVRHEFENKTRFPRDNNNIGPRAGFAWSPNSKTVIRGGYGIFYSRIDGQVAYIEDLLGENQQIQQAFVPLTGLPGTISPVTGQPVTSAEIYQSLRGILGSRPVTLDDIAAHGVNVGPNSPLRVQFRVAEDIVNPYSQQGSFEIQRAVADYSFSAAYNFNRGIHLIRPLDTNVYRAGTNAQGLPVAGFRNPLILQDNVYGSWANSSYHALILQLKKRLSKGFMLSAHHTWSKTMDENTDYNSSFEPHYQWDAKAERALSSYHRGHRFVAHAVVQSPWKAGAGKGFAHNLFGDFTVSGIAVARSFAPFNLNAGFDNIGDRHTDTHRPHGVGRNIGIGPNFFTFDIRLSRQFSLGDEGRKNIQLVAEAFNLFNRTNFKNVNGTVGQTSLDELPDSLRGRRGPVTEPFSFTSAFEPRQFQFSLRFNF